MKVLFALVLVSLLSVTLGANQVVFNPESPTLGNCTTAGVCWFFDPTLWVNGVIPAPDDNVTIANITAGRYVFLNTSIFLGSLLIDANFNLEITAQANVTFQDITLQNSARLFVNDQAQAYGLGSTWITLSSELSVNGIAFAQAGNLLLLDNSSSIWAFNNAYVGLHALSVIIRGSLSFSANTMFASTGGTIEFINEAFTLEVTPILYSSVFRNSQITFKNGLRGTRSANLIESSVVIENLSPSVLNNFTVDALSVLSIVGIASCTLANQNITGSLVISSSNIVTNLTSFGPVTFVGQVNVNSTSAYFDVVSFQAAPNGAAPNLTLNTQFLGIDGSQSVDFPQVTFNVQGFAHILGPVHIEGVLNAGGGLMLKDSYLEVIGEVNIGYYFGEFLQYPPQLFLQESHLVTNILNLAPDGFFLANYSTIEGNVTLHHNSSLKHHFSTFTGQLTNYGIVTLEHPLMTGNFTQGDQGILLSYVELANQSAGYLNVHGTANINGAIQYYVASQPVEDRKLQLVVVQTTEGVTGKFKTEPQSINTTQHKTSLMYTKNDVYLIFNDGGSSSSGAPWWVWLLVAFGIVAIIGLIALLVVTWRRRQYQAVEM